MEIFVFIAFVAVGALLFLVLNKDEDPIEIPKPSGQAIKRQSPPDSSGEITPANIQNRESQQAVLESYPALKEISYMPVTEALAPVTADNMDAEQMASVKGKISTVKPVPTNYFTLMNLLRNPESNSLKIASLVMTNPVFSAKILQTINSAYFNLPDKVTSVGRAITLLGFNNVRSLVLQDALSDVVGGKQYGGSEAYMKNWSHSAVVSVCAGYLGQQLFKYPENEVATIGLLHDIGKYFMGLFELRGAAQADLPLVIREEKEYGINHAALGGLIAHQWQLSDIIIKTIEYHHHPVFLPPEEIPETYRRYSFIINLSDLVCKALGYAGDDGDLHQIKNEYFELFKLPASLPDFITSELIKKMEKAHLAVQSYMTAT